LQFWKNSGFLKQKRAVKAEELIWFVVPYHAAELLVTLTATDRRRNGGIEAVAPGGAT
jgi:hypothetical protein